MPKISDVAAELDLKQKSLVKTQAAIKTISNDFKKIATEQQKAENSAKSEKEPKKKKTLQDESNKLRKEGESLLGKRTSLEKTVESLEKAIVALTKQLKEMKEGLAAYGKSRTDYVEWFKGEKTKLDKELAEVKRMCEAAEVERDKTEKAVEEGNAIKGAEAAGASEKFAEFTKAASKKVALLIASWSSRWTEQRNLAPSAFGVDTSDVKVHAAVTSKMYETFKVGDSARDLAAEYVEKAETAAEEAEVLLKAGRKSAAVYEEMLAKTAKLIANKVKEYDDVFATTWGKIMIDEGARFRQEASLIKKGETATVARALKIAEQARAAIPKAVANCENIIKQANELATKERSRIPGEFQRALKPKVDQLGLLVMELLKKHRSNQPKIAKTMEALTALEEAAG